MNVNIDSPLNAQLITFFEHASGIVEVISAFGDPTNRNRDR